MINGFTVDVEDYFQVTGFEAHITRSQWLGFTRRVVASTQRLLDFCARRRIKATFFVLGWVAEHHPELVQEIAAAGHEIGSHGYWHRLVYQQSPAEFRDDLRRSQAAIGAAIGRVASAYRAPSFSITRRSLWALQILVEEGFRIDSSIFPIRHDRYGIPDAPVSPFIWHTDAGPIVEFPATAFRIRRLSIPASGGGYFRVMPYRVTEALLTRVVREQRPFVFYVHPWEVDPDQPRLKSGTRQARFRHYVNLSKTMNRLERLADRFPLGALSESLERYLASVKHVEQRTASHSTSTAAPAPFIGAV